MKTLEFIYDTENFAVLSGIYAEKEQEIDFLHDFVGAELCTASFCACELAKYLKLTDPELHCVFASRPSGKNSFIRLECTSQKPSDGGFSFLVKKKNQLTIRAVDRNGLVNGTYEFLRLQGWRWIEPGADGEFAPKTHKIIFPAADKVYQPSFKYRAFYFEYPSQASLDFLLWMARNRMNVYGSFPELRALAKKLGMYLLSGGHILTKLMKPDRLMESGKTLLEEHPDWFGTRGDGEKITVKNAQRTQFCCSSSGLMDYLSNELIRRLNQEWLGTDILEVSGFDTWGNTCMCPKCRDFSDSDKYLLFMSALRERFDRAYKTGKLKHNPMLNTWAYEGTATMSAPTRIPENMVRAQDNCVAFVIKRCYKHPMGDSPDCPINAEYAETIKSWGKLGRQMTLWGGEYYNVSKHEDLPLLFTANMRESMKFYYRAGARGITYMHTPIFGWGVRGITQNLHAGLPWDIQMDTDAFCKEFLALRYGEFASDAAEAYAEIEKASADVAEWRSWRQSILDCFQTFWATGEAKNPLAQRHYRSNADVIRGGRKIAGHYRKAAALLTRAFDAAFDHVPAAPYDQLLVNPEELDRNRVSQRQLHFLECDLRSLRYAIDVITLMTGCAEAYDAIQRKDFEKLAKLQPKLEKQARQMSFYTESVTYRAYIPHVETRSALERSQCGPFVRVLKSALHPDRKNRKSKAD